jgi:predicted nucleotidyltransferase
LQELIASKREEITQLCRRYHVRRLAVFGSAARDDFDPERSDVDMRVEFEPLSESIYAENYFALHRSLEILLGRKVDLISARHIRNPYRKREIERTQETLYAA